jgi:fluoride ion exporter CrcB/FEX
VSHPREPLALPPWKLALAAFAGGIMGSAARGGCEWIFALVGAPAWTSRLAVNVVGAFALGVVFGRLCEPDERGVPLGVPHRNRMREHLWGSGFMGGFTTVSGFAWDVAWAMQHGEHARVAAMLAVDGVVGIAAAAAGYASALRARMRREPAVRGGAPHP